MAALTANSFGYVTLCLFSVVRKCVQKGSEGAVDCVYLLLWATCYASLIYSVMHTGHFARKEVYIT